MPGSGKKRAKGDAAAPRGEEEADDAESDDDQVEEEVFVGLRQLGMQTGYAFCYLGGGKGNIYQFKRNGTIWGSTSNRARCNTSSSRSCRWSYRSWSAPRS